MIKQIVKPKRVLEYNIKHKKNNSIKNDVINNTEEVKKNEVKTKTSIKNNTPKKNSINNE